jgi:cell division protein FtsW (lipid II flippase)
MFSLFATFASTLLYLQMDKLPPDDYCYEFLTKYESIFIAPTGSLTVPIYSIISQFQASAFLLLVAVWLAIRIQSGVMPSTVVGVCFVVVFSMLLIVWIKLDLHTTRIQVERAQNPSKIDPNSPRTVKQGFS